MRDLKFIVENQILKPDPSCNFNDLVPGTEGYVRAIFSFSPEWTGFKKVATFSSAMGKKYQSQSLSGEKTSCIIPMQALARRVFKIQVHGEKGTLKLTTNKVAISQNGGKHE